MTTRNRKLWSVVLVCLAMGAITLLAAALPGLELRHGQQFVIEGQARGETPLRAGGRPPLGIEPILVILGLILLLMLAGTIIYAIISREGRKELLRRLLPFVLLLIVLLLGRQEPPPVPLSTPAPTALPEVGGIPGPQAMRAMFDASPPRWLLWATGAAIAVAVLVAVAVLLWLLWPRERGAAGPLEELANQAQSAVEALEAGADWRDTILRCYFEMARTVSCTRGIDRGEAMTPREFEGRLVKAGLPPPPVRRLTMLFEQVRYGAWASNRGEEQEAIDCLASIAQACRWDA